MITQICLLSSNRVPCTTLLFSRPLRTTVRPSCKISGSAAGNAGKKMAQKSTLPHSLHGSPCLTPMSERVETGMYGKRCYQTTNSAILGYLSASTAAPEPVKGGTRFKSRILKSHLKLMAFCAVIWCSTRFMYSAVHTKPLRRLQILSKEAPG